MADLEKTIIQIRETLERSYPLLLKQCGITETGDMGKAIAGFEALREKILPIIQADEAQQGPKEARRKFIQEAAFTTLNRLIGLKVMETRGLLERTYLTRSIDTGGKSAAHYLYLSANPQAQNQPGQGIHTVLEEIFQSLSQQLPQLYNSSRYGLLPRPSDTMTVIDLINAIDPQEWQKDDIIGWVYQYYNMAERKALKDRADKIDQTNVHYQSQQYTPAWVVKHIVDNTLGRTYLEMCPDSPLYDQIEIPIPKDKLKKERQPKKLETIKLLDPACGSGNFLLYAFELLYKMYQEQGYAPETISSLILEHNLCGIDLDDRAVQLTILSLYLKAKSRDQENKRYTMNVVSADFHLSDTVELATVRNKYRSDTNIQDFIDLIWSQLKKAPAIGSLLDITGGLEELKEKKKKRDPMFFQEEAWQEKEIQVLEDIKGAVSNNKEYGAYIQQGMNFTELLIQKYDVVVANPPYLDSSDMADSYKSFLKDRFKGFDKNLYAAFMKRCADFAIEGGYVGMITPQTYMFISSYEKTRAFLLKEFNITSFVHVGLGGVFERGVDVDIAIFCMKKEMESKPAVFIKLNQFSRTPQEPFKKNHLWDAIDSLRRGKRNELVYKLNQSEFKKIPDEPFLYWISDRIRGIFGMYNPLQRFADIVAGLSTGENDHFLRYWWEVKEEDISSSYSKDRKKWVPYAKGGPYNKWYGNLWWVVDWEDTGECVKNFSGSVVRNEPYYFKKGLTIQRVTSGIASVRLLEENHIFDSAVSAVFSKKAWVMPLLGIMLSRFFWKILHAKNPTTNKQAGEVKSVPLPEPILFTKKAICLSALENLLSGFVFRSNFSVSDPITLSWIAEDCIAQKKALYSFHVMEQDFQFDPFSWALEKQKKENQPIHIKTALKRFFLHKALLEARLLINEALNDELVFQLYELLPENLTLTETITQVGLLDPSSPEGESINENEDLSAVLEVLRSEGIPPGAFPQRELTEKERKELKNQYLRHRHDRGSGRSETITGMEFGIVEEIASTLKVSPVTVVEEIAQIDSLPEEAVKDVLSEHIQAIVIEIMRQDNEGIVSLSTDTAETSLPTRIIEKWRAMGIGDTYNELESLLGKKIDTYLLKDFFKDHAKRFMNRPIVWHLVSDKGRFNFFVLHHRWNYDRILLLKSKYLPEVKRTLENTLATELNEKKRADLMEQMAELDRFATKLNELLDGTYLPEVDSGVAKNIAPLQKKGLLKYNPLSGKMVEKMLKVKW